MSLTRTRSAPHRALALALAAALVLGGAGCTASGSDSTAPPAAPGVAGKQLDELTVAATGSTRGYSRERFPHWRQAGPNCNVRDVVLRRDGSNVTVDGCNVTGGRWLSVYDDKWYDAPSAVDIDHMVPLANAWRSGAAGWDDNRRGDFANDLERPQLIAVSATTNRAKGDQDPSRWRPPNRDYWCKYAHSWIAVKHYWQLTVTAEEKAALHDMLETCQWQTNNRPSTSN